MIFSGSNDFLKSVKWLNIIADITLLVSHGIFKKKTNMFQFWNLLNFKITLKEVVFAILLFLGKCCEDCPPCKVSCTEELKCSHMHTAPCYEWTTSIFELDCIRQCEKLLDCGHRCTKR